MTIKATSIRTTTDSLADNVLIDSVGGKLTLANAGDIAQGDVFYINGDDELDNLPAGTSGYFLKTQGASTNPVWAELIQQVELVSSQVLSSASSTITFSSLSLGAYTSLILQIKGLGSTTGQTPFIRFNSDTGSNYTWMRDYTTGNDSNSGDNKIIYPSAQNGSTAGFTEMKIKHLPTSQNRIVLANGYKPTDMTQINGSWNNTSDAITSITLGLDTGNYAIGTEVYLYGVI